MISICADKKAEWRNGALFVRCELNEVSKNSEGERFFWLTGDITDHIVRSSAADAKDPPLWVVMKDDNGNDALHRVEAFVIHKGGDTQVFFTPISLLLWPKI